MLIKCPKCGSHEIKLMGEQEETNSDMMRLYHCCSCHFNYKAYEHSCTDIEYIMRQADEIDFLESML